MKSRKLSKLLTLVLALAVAASAAAPAWAAEGDDTDPPTTGGTTTTPGEDGDGDGSGDVTPTPTPAPPAPSEVSYALSIALSPNDDTVTIQQKGLTKNFIAAPTLTKTENGTSNTVPIPAGQLSYTWVWTDEGSDSEKPEEPENPENPPEEVPGETPEQPKEDPVAQLGNGMVGENGQGANTLTALRPGRGTVTVTASVTIEGKKVEGSITRNVEVRGIRITNLPKNDPPGPGKLYPNASHTLTLEIFGSNIGSASSAQWTSDNSSVAYASSGNIITQNLGEATITATLGDYSDSCKITVVEDTTRIIDVTMPKTQQTLDFDDAAPFEEGSLLSQIKAKCEEVLYNLQGEEREMAYVRSMSVSPNEGTLFYNYLTSANPNQGIGSEKYYVSPSQGQRGLGDITFVPKAGFSGVATIRYTACINDSVTCTGTLRIRVEMDSDVSYDAAVGSPVSFEAADFAAVYQRMTTRTLSNVSFMLPPKAQGMLYYNYSPSAVYPIAVQENTKYYRWNDPAIDKISFLPAENLVGDSKVYIYYVARDSGGFSYSGRVTVNVAGNQPESLPPVKYTVTNSQGVKFSAADFKLAGENKGDVLYVNFAPITQGTLYYKYDTPQEDVVAPNVNYYKNGTPGIGDLTFIPNTGSGETVTLSFTGYSDKSAPIEGKVEIKVEIPAGSSINYSGNSLPIQFWESDFLDTCRYDTKDQKAELAFVRFTGLPQEAQGRLYTGYTGTGVGAKPITTEMKCGEKDQPSLNDIQFVARPNFQGRVAIPFVGETKEGKEFSGTVAISVANNYWDSQFGDLGNYSWAQGSVEFLYSSGVVNGVSANRYSPAAPIKRGDFTLMVCRALGFDTTNKNASFPDVPIGDYYAGAVATAKSLGIVTGDDTGRFRPMATITRQDAMLMLHRAMKKAGYELPMGSFNSLKEFSDYAQVDRYAESAVASLVELGVVQGSGQRLKPKSSITRAEMAVVLHRALTL